MRFIMHCLFLFFLFSTIFIRSTFSEREVRVTSVPLKSTEASKEDDINPMASDAVEHAAKKKKFIQELQTEAGEFKKLIEGTQDPVMKNERELKFRESRREKITTFLEEEKRREEMKKEVDRLKKSSGVFSS